MEQDSWEIAEASIELRSRIATMQEMRSRSISKGGATTAEQLEREESQLSRQIPKVTWADIGGLDTTIRRLREMVELPFKAPQVFRHLGVQSHRSALLYGPPGTGKTLLAKAIAHECKAHFMGISGPEFVSKYSGQSERNLRGIFREAKTLAPAIVLFDEIDAAAPKRESSMQDHDARRVGQLLALLDGLYDRGNVLVLATTNRPEDIDPALRRPGRLDLHILVPLPDKTGREQILAVHTRKMPLSADVNLRQLAAQTAGFSGADLAALCREAAFICLRRSALYPELLAKGKKRFGTDAIDSLQVSMADFTAATAFFANRVQPHLDPKWREES